MTCPWVHLAFGERAGPDFRTFLSATPPRISICKKCFPAFSRRPGVFIGRRSQRFFTKGEARKYLNPGQHNPACFRSPYSEQDFSKGLRTQVKDQDQAKTAHRFLSGSVSSASCSTSSHELSMTGGSSGSSANAPSREILSCGRYEKSLSKRSNNSGPVGVRISKWVRLITLEKESRGPIFAATSFS